MIQVNWNTEFLKGKYITYFSLTKQSTHTHVHMCTYAHRHTILNPRYCVEVFVPSIEAWEEFSAK